jgi:hypothetical protein
VVNVLCDPFLFLALFYFTFPHERFYGHKLGFVTKLTIGFLFVLILRCFSMQVYVSLLNEIHLSILVVCKSASSHTDYSSLTHLTVKCIEVRGLLFSSVVQHW